MNTPKKAFHRFIFSTEFSMIQIKMKVVDFMIFLLLLIIGANCKCFCQCEEVANVVKLYGNKWSFIGTGSQDCDDDSMITTIFRFYFFFSSFFRPPQPPQILLTTCYHICTLNSIFVTIFFFHPQRCLIITHLFL